MSKAIQVLKLIWELEILPRKYLYEIARKISDLPIDMAESPLRAEYLRYITEAGDIAALTRARREGLFKNGDAWDLLCDNLNLPNKTQFTGKRPPYNSYLMEGFLPGSNINVDRWYAANFEFNDEQIATLLKHADLPTQASLLSSLSAHLSDEKYGQQVSRLISFAIDTMHRAHMPEIITALDLDDPNGKNYPLLRAYMQAKMKCILPDKSWVNTMEGRLLAVARLQQSYAERYGERETVGTFGEESNDFTSDARALLKAYKQYQQNV
jgi:hypothetical protein